MTTEVQVKLNHLRGAAAMAARRDTPSLQAVWVSRELMVATNRYALIVLAPEVLTCEEIIERGAAFDQDRAFEVTPNLLLEAVANSKLLGLRPKDAREITLDIHAEGEVAIQGHVLRSKALPADVGKPGHAYSRPGVSGLVSSGHKVALDPEAYSFDPQMFGLMDKVQAAITGSNGYKPKVSYLGATTVSRATGHPQFFYSRILDKGCSWVAMVMPVRD